MAATGFTPISLYYSATASAVPLAANLTAGELALNTNDGKLYYKNSSGAVTLLASGSTASGSFTNLSYTGTLTGGTGIVNLGSGQFYKDSSGNVGMGTTAPSKKLEVFASANSLQIESVVRNDQSGSGVAAIGFNVSASAASETTSTKAGIGLVRTNSYGVGPLAFYVNSTTSVGDFTTADERVRIDTGGNLLLGTTTSPAGSKELVLGGDYIEGVVAIGSSGTAKTIALTNGTVQTVTLTGNCTFTMPTAVAGKSFILILSTGAGSFTATFTSVKWPSNTAPTITTTASRWDILTFVSDGTNWYGNFAQAYQ